MENTEKKVDENIHLLWSKYAKQQIDEEVNKVKDKAKNLRLNTFDFEEMLRQANKDLYSDTPWTENMIQDLQKNVLIKKEEGSLLLLIPEHAPINLGKITSKHSKFLIKMFDKNKDQFGVKWSLESIVGSIKNPKKSYPTKEAQKSYLVETIMEAIYKRLRIAGISNPTGLIKLTIEDDLSTCWIETP